MAARRNRNIEDVLQEQCAFFLDHRTDLFWYHPSPNSYRAALAMKAPEEYCRRFGAEAKRRGVKPGVPDIFIMDTPPNFPDKKGVFIELKTKTGRLSDEQVQFRDKALERGFLFFLVRESVINLIAVLTECGFPTRH